jgi:hypothetical protein
MKESDPTLFGVLSGYSPGRTDESNDNLSR